MGGYPILSILDDTDTIRFSPSAAALGSLLLSASVVIDILTLCATQFVSTFIAGKIAPNGQTCARGDVNY